MNLENLRAKFFSDPDWAEMEELIKSYIDPLASCLDIDTKNLTNYQIATEVRGRQMSYDSMYKFLSSSKVLSKSRPEFNRVNPFK